MDIAEEFHIKGLTRDETTLKSNSSPTPLKRARSNPTVEVINTVPQPQDYDESIESCKTSHFEDSTKYRAYDEDFSNSVLSQTYSKANYPRRGQHKVKMASTT